MAEIHGIYTKEIPFMPLADAATDVTIPFVVGTAPVNLSTLDTPPVNVPVFARNWAEAVAALGYSEDWESYTLSEMMYSHFMLYNQGPIILVNVLDPATHVAVIAPASRQLVRGMITLPDDGIIKSTITVSSSDGNTTYVPGTDYTVTANDTGRMILSRKSSSAIGATDTLLIGYSKLDAGEVDATDIIGGVDGVTGKVTGLELIKQVLPRFQVLPSLILAPGFSDNPIVAAVMKSKVNDINGIFKAEAITDIPANILPANVPTWKADNFYNDQNQITTYPKATFQGKTYHMSTQIAGAICSTDAVNAGVPYKSPSNKTMFIDSTVLEDGTEIALGFDEANVLEYAGVVTAINFVGGWKSWGNRTSVYPALLDPQSTFIPVRRMFNWISNKIVTMNWTRLDDATNKRLRTTILDDMNIWMNGLVSNEYVLGGRVVFLESDNPAANLLEGKLVYRVYATPPSPAKELEFLVSYDAQYLSTITG